MVKPGWEFALLLCQFQKSGFGNKVNRELVFISTRNGRSAVFGESWAILGGAGSGGKLTSASKCAVGLGVHVSTSTSAPRIRKKMPQACVCRPP